MLTGEDVGEAKTLAGEYDVELVTSALKGLHKSFEQHGNTLFNAREVFARSSERLVTIGPKTFSSAHLAARDLTFYFIHTVLLAIDPVECTEMLLGQSHEFRPERVQQPDIWTAVVASLKEFRKKWGLDDSVASEIAARIERERSRLGQEMDNSKKTAGKSKTEGTDDGASQSSLALPLALHHGIPCPPMSTDDHATASCNDDQSPKPAVEDPLKKQVFDHGCPSLSTSDYIAQEGELDPPSDYSCLNLLQTQPKSEISDKNNFRTKPV